jgi:hypothetical protein
MFDYQFSGMNPENVAAEAARIGGGRGMNLYQETDQLTLMDFGRGHQILLRRNFA